MIKYLTLSQERFANRDSLAPASKGETERWDGMLYGKWIDPLFAIMAIFEAARRGETHEVARVICVALELQATTLSTSSGQNPAT